MAFKLNSDNVWVPNLPVYELGAGIAVGDWNIGPGGGRFAPIMRDVLTLAQKAKIIKAAGATHMEFHDTEAEPEQATEIAKIVQDAGLGIHMCTANLFKRGPEFAGGNFGSPNPDVRKAAIERTKTYIRAGIEAFHANVYVYWNGSNGFSHALEKSYRDMASMTADCINEIVLWMIDEYGPERALAFCIEPKGNEPPSWGFPGDCGEALAVISMLDERARPFVGTNIETCHSQLVGKRYAAELGLAAAAGKCYYVHLNGGSGIKFDEDNAFGDHDFGVAVETMYTLREIGYNSVMGVDVQPLNTDTNAQQGASIERSIRNVKRALACCDRIDGQELAALQMAGTRAGIADLFVRAVTGLD